MKKPLYEITQDKLALYQEIEELEGEITPEMEEALKINEGQLQSKGIGYIEIIEDRNSFNVRIDAEIKRLGAMKKANTRLVDHLEFNLLEAVKNFGDIDTGFKTITTSKSSSVVVEDVNLLPKEFKVIKVTESADKNKLKAAIKSGKKIKGVELVENKNLKFK